MNASSQDADVIGTSQNIQFQAGDTDKECKFTVADDNIPEANETYAIELIVSGSGTVISPSVAYLTILANDDAFGIIGFNEVCRKHYRYQSSLKLQRFCTIFRKIFMMLNLRLWHPAYKPLKFFDSFKQFLILIFYSIIKIK